MIEDWPAYATLILVFVFGFYLQRIDGRVRSTNARLGRLSLTFQKIENDLDAVQNSLLVLAKNNPEMAEEIGILKDRRPLVFRHILESGPNAEGILRGLDWPDINDDPVFWKQESVADRMQLPKNLEDVRNPKVDE